MDSWQSNETYLFGVDLYNFAYWWEAHEQWEALWCLEERSVETAAFLQGLIQLSASLLKWHAGNQRGFTQLVAKGCQRLKRVTVESSYMGTNLQQLIAAYQAFKDQSSPGFSSVPPTLLLNGLGRH